MKTVDQTIERLIEIAIDAIYDGDCHRARALIESAFFDEPAYPKLHSTLAWMYHYHQINMDLAQRYYLLAIHFDADYEYAWNGLIDILLTQKRYVFLKSKLLQARNNSQLDQEFILKTLGKVTEKQGQFSEALKYYKEALMESTDNEDSAELKKNVRRIRMKRFKTIIRQWQPQN
jgi:Tfp pilus assembly protein PilF